MMSVEVQCEAASIGYWFHISSPLDNWGVYETLVGGLAEAKREYHAALAAHDRARAGCLLLEVADLTALCAAAADALDSQRWLWMRADKLWPLGLSAALSTAGPA